MVKAKVYKLVKHFKNFPEASDLEYVEEELPPIKDGEYLAEAIFLSLDPYMWMACGWIPLGQTMIGAQIAKIVESKNPKFPVGRLVAGTFGWRTHTINDGKTHEFTVLQKDPYLLPDLGDLSPSLGLGILGMSGCTAYFGTVDSLGINAGDTLVVSGAAGAVGSIVGQIGKIKGAKVIGLAGSEEKGKVLTEKFGFDHFINYKTQDIDKELSTMAPKGVNAYYDNVGGKITTTVQKHMASQGRITIVGAISKYETSSDFSLDSFGILSKELTVRGFIVNSYIDRWDEGVNQLLQWIKEGKLKYQEHVTEGFENMFQAFVGLLKGKFDGKAVVKV